MTAKMFELLRRATENMLTPTSNDYEGWVDLAYDLGRLLQYAQAQERKLELESLE